MCKNIIMTLETVRFAENANSLKFWKKNNGNFKIVFYKNLHKNWRYLSLYVLPCKTQFGQKCKKFDLEKNRSIGRKEKSHVSRKINRVI